MKADIETLQDTFKIGYEAFEESRREHMEMLDLFHNRQYTDDQLNVLANRGQPAETFNIIKLFARMLLGYYSTVVNAIKVEPVKINEVITAGILHDIVDYTMRVNNMNSEGDKIKLDAILSGLMASYTEVVDTGEKDQFGRPKYNIVITPVSTLELVLDPMSRQDDNSDARFTHRFKWVSKETIIKDYGKDKLEGLDSYNNHLDIEEAEFTYAYNTQFQGKYKIFDNYLVVHTIITDDNDKTWSVFWSADTILSKKEITYKEVKNPYRVHRLHTSNRTEYYGIFREVKETQHAINQALVKIQLMVNTQKAFVEDGAVDNLDNFIHQFNRVNAVIPVKDLSGIRIENLTREVLDQYTVIDKALDRVQRILSINDSFLGMAYASDSGAKVKLQQNASVVALRYVTSRVEQFYRLLGWDILNLIKQYYTAYDVIRIADSNTGSKWVELNRPMEIPTGRMLPDGTPEMRYMYEEVIDPATNKPIVDDEGNYIMAPIPTEETEIAFTKCNIKVDSIAYNDEDERSQVVLEQFVNGPIGNILSQVNPVGYFKTAGLAMKNLKSKYSLEIAGVLEETAVMLSGQQQMQQQMQQGELSGQMTQSQAMNKKQG